jgi:integrase
MARIARPKPPLSRTWTPDAEVGGLYKVTQPSGKESGHIRYRGFDGRSRNYKIGDYGKLSAKDMRQLAKKAFYSIANGIDPGEEKKRLRIAARTPVDADLVEKVAVEFIKRHVPHLATSTQRAVVNIVNKNILPMWRGRKLSSITKVDVHALLDTISDRGAPIMANRTFAWLQVLCNWAIGRGLIEINPCNGVKRSTPEPPRDRTLDDSELVELWGAAAKLTQPFGQYVKILALTGQRSHEVSDMEQAELDLSKRIWVIPARRTKNGREHTVPLSELACSIIEPLLRFHQGGTFVFSLTGSRAMQGHHIVKRDLDALLPQEMPPWHLHDLRRTAASGMARLGVNQQVVEKLLNHVSGSFRGIVSVYQQHDYLREKTNAVERWAEHIERIIHGEADDNVVRFTHGK